jgi:hypothetical protein
VPNNPPLRTYNPDSHSGELNGGELKFKITR